MTEEVWFTEDPVQGHGTSVPNTALPYAEGFRWTPRAYQMFPGAVVPSR
jgi:hypothetical protein